MEAAFGHWVLEGSGLQSPESGGSPSQGRGAPGSSLICRGVGRLVEGEGRFGECGGKRGGNGELVCLGEGLACHP